MRIELEHICGLPVAVEYETCNFILGKEMNSPSYRIRNVHDLDKVWAGKVNDYDRMIYQYTSGLWLTPDQEHWKKANIIYGIVVFTPGIFAGEYNKSAGQYHPVIPPNTKATPEIYSVLHGIGHFMLQKSLPPYDIIEDAVLVEVTAGESFVVPPDYGHLQINCGNEPLIFSYTVMDGMQGVYEPFKEKGGAVYYEMAQGNMRYVFNTNYAEKPNLRFIKAAEICQLPPFNNNFTYQKIRDNLELLTFITDPEKFPSGARL